MTTPNFAREAIQKIAGYAPGEQISGRRIIKLNTNECPYPPSPKCGEALASFDWQALHLYPNPTAASLRQCAARLFGFDPDEILCGNGSDDLLTIALRTFVDAGQGFAYTEPSYSLYPVLAELQGARKIPVQLTDDVFDLPSNVVEQAADAKVLMLARPNAPTGNSFAMADMCRLCEQFQGVVWIDEAYADFADDNCLELVHRYPNVIVSRTFSKSYALAGLRLGMAFADKAIIAEMNKLKDSYNTDRFAQCIGEAALMDQRYLRENVAKIRATRQRSAEFFTANGCQVLPSQTNFLMIRPAHKTAARLFSELREEGILVRYFALPRIDGLIRVTIGTDAQMDELFNAFLRLDK